MIKKEKTMSFIDLESVGSTLTSDLKIFPMDISEAPETASDADEMMGVHIYDLDNEWFHNLSSVDLKSFFNFLVEVNFIILFSKSAKSLCANLTNFEPEAFTPTNKEL